MGRVIIAAILAICAAAATKADDPWTCACPAVWEPVCCNDGFTYENHFCIECINDHPDYPGPPLEVVSAGFCTEGYECTVPSNYEPVCCSDMKTYPNKEAVFCYNADPNTTTEVTIWFEGICPSADCPIPEVYHPVCASDGNTYDNEYVVECINEANPNHPIEIVSEGPCED